MTRAAKIFLCYAPDDEQQVREIYDRLRARGEEPWIEPEGVLPGQKHEPVSTQQIREADVFLACLSAHAVDTPGPFHRRLNAALEAWSEKPRSQIFLVPLRLDECVIPEELRQVQRVDWFEENAWERLTKAIDVRMGRTMNSVEPVFAEGWDAGDEIVMGLFTYPKKGEGGKAPVQLDWEDIFLSYEPGTPPPPEKVWLDSLLPALGTLRRKVGRACISTIRLYPQAHISACLALGHAFRGGGFRFVIDQRGDWWRYDDPAEGQEFEFDPIPLHADGTDVTLEVGIPQDVSMQALEYIEQHNLPVRERIRLLMPEPFRSEPGQARNFVQGGRHAQRLIQQITSALLREKRASTIHLFAALPAAMAVFVGEQMNTARPVQCYELNKQTGKYEPSCYLAAG